MSWRFMAVLGVLAVPSLARADYYFTLQSGESIGPYATYDACQAARYTNQVWIHSNLCVGGDGTTAGPSTPTAGIGRLYGGAAFAAVSSGNAIDARGYLAGMQLARGYVPHHPLYAFADVFVGSQDITPPAGGTAHVDQFGVVFGPELSSGGGRVAAFIQLGVGFVFASSGGQNDWVGVKGGAGLDISLSDGFGVLVFGMGTATPNVPGLMLAGLALEWRSPRLSAARR